EHMPTPISMPALGESVTEGTVTQWLKQEGDTVEADEPLLEVSTDKVDTEIPSPVSGVLTKILVGEDETVEVGAQIAIISGADDPRLQVSTDTVDTEIPSPVSGVLTKILVGEDETVEVGAQIAIISGADEAPEAQPAPEESAQAAAEPEPEPEPAPQPAAEEA